MKVLSGIATPTTCQERKHPYCVSVTDPRINGERKPVQANDRDLSFTHSEPGQSVETHTEQKEAAGEGQPCDCSNRFINAREAWSTRRTHAIEVTRVNCRKKKRQKQRGSLLTRKRQTASEQTTRASISGNTLTHW